MTTLDNLSPNAQALVQALEHAAQSSAASRGAGYPQIHEDQVGGFEHVTEAIAEIRAAGVDVRASAGERDRFIRMASQSGAPLRVGKR